VRGFERPPHRWSPQTIDADRLDALLEADARVERDALRRGVHYQVLYDQVEVDDPARWPDLRASLDAGEEARVYDGLPLKLVLFDDWAATTPMVDPSGNYAGLVVVHKSPLLDALSALFEAYWDRAVPLTAVRNRISASDTHTVSDPQDERLMSLLAGGLTDASIARTLGVSRSTVQRRVNQLMALHGARTRLQLGLQLGRLWSR
jgi:DNA-binding CsgD family transcriptional regulator